MFLEDGFTEIDTNTTTWTAGYCTIYNTVTLSDVTVNGDVTLILEDGATLTVSNGITVGSDASLTIYAQSTGSSMGELVVTTGGLGSTGDTSINGGTITATGGDNGSGIYGDEITINAGTITATGGTNGYGINGDTIIINAGTITATGGDYSDGINGSTITINAGTITAIGGDSGNGIVATTITIADTLMYGASASGIDHITSADYGTGSAISNFSSDQYTFVGYMAAYLNLDGEIIFNCNPTVVTTNDTQWSTGWYVVDSTVTISSRIEVIGDVYLILADGATLYANAGITVEDDNSLTIYAQSDGDTMGKLEATVASIYAQCIGTDAGIGGTAGNSAGIITINGGNITATGGATTDAGGYTASGAGIGGGGKYWGSAGSGGTVTINGGTVTATSGCTGGWYSGTGAGIGGGGTYQGTAGSGGTVTINGGTVTATGSYTGAGTSGAGAGIGGGGTYQGTAGSGGTVTINGGTVTATGGSAWNTSGSGSGIGGGGSFLATPSVSGTVTIPDYMEYGTSTSSISEISSFTTGTGTEISDFSTDRYVQVQLVTLSITVQSVTATYGDSVSLSAEATAGNATIAYQWYTYDADNEIGAVIGGATSAIYAPTDLSAGTYYYYCVASCTLNSEDVTTTSEIATVTISKADQTADGDVTVTSTYNATNDNYDIEITSHTNPTESTYEYAFQIGDTDVGAYSSTASTTVSTDDTTVTAYIRIAETTNYNVSDAINGSVTTGTNVIETAMEAALGLIDSNTFTDLADTVITEALVISAIETQVKAISGIDLTGITITVNTTSFTEATAGDYADNDGTEGSYTFTVTLTATDFTDVTGVTSDSDTVKIAAVEAATLTDTVALTGDAVYNSELTATVTTANGTGDYTYEWYRGDTKIDGADQNTYTLVTADIGYTITVKVNTPNQAGQVTATSDTVIAAGSTGDITTPEDTDGKTYLEGGEDIVYGETYYIAYTPVIVPVTNGIALTSMVVDTLSFADETVVLYYGATAVATATGITLGETATLSFTVTKNLFTDTDAFDGTTLDAFTIGWGGDTSANGSSETIYFNLTKATIDNVTVDETDGAYTSAYTGLAQAFTDITLTSDDVVDGDTVTLTTSYTTTAAIVGDYAVSGTVVLGGTHAGYYVLAETIAFDGDVSIIQATHDDATATGSAMYGNSGSVSLSAWTELDGYSFAIDTVTDESGVLVENSDDIEDNALVFAFENVADNVCETAIVYITVSSTNYEDFTITVTLTVTSKITPTISAENFSKPYDTETITIDDITVSVEDEVAGSWAFEDGATMTNVADTDTYTVMFTPDDANTYVETSTEITVTITAYEITLSVDDASAYRNYSEPTYTYTQSSELLGEDQWISEPTIDNSAVNMASNGTYTLTISADAGNNYSIITEDGTLTITTKSSSSTTTTTTTTTTTDTTTNDDGSVTATASTSSTTSGSTVTVTVSDSNMETAIENAVDADAGDGLYVEIEATTKSSTDTVVATFSTDAADDLVDSDVDALIVTSDLGTVTISHGALGSIASQADGSDIIITVEQLDTDALTDAQKAVIGNGFAVNLTVTSGGKVISSFGGYEIIVTLPYQLKEGESAENIVIWHIADDGTVTVMDTTYDAETGMATFGTTHFSVYAIIHDTNTFTDVNPNAYYYNPVLWAAENGITSGYSDDTFRPSASCTRAQAVTFLWRAAGEPTATIDNPFSDLDADAYYYDAVLWAVEMGITTGYDDGTFRPNTTCNRGAIVTFLYRFAGEPDVSGTALSDVADGAYYYNAVLWAVENGITTGYSDNTFRPTTTCNRGAIVTFLYRYLGQ